MGKLRDFLAETLKQAANVISKPGPAQPMPPVPASGPLGPGDPLRPSPIDREIEGRIPARIWDYPPNFNLQNKGDSERQIGYKLLQAFADNHPIARAAIDVRKDDINALEWDIVAVDRTKKVDEGKRLAVKQFFQKPDASNPFSQWLNMALEDVFVTDTLCIEKRRTRKGELVGLDLIDGTTIVAKLDRTGRIRRPPDAAYQQVIKGSVVSEFTTQELIYDPLNNRTRSPYGRSLLESCLLEINTSFRGSMYLLNFFTQGKIPYGFATAPEGWDMKDIIAFQEKFNKLLEGDDAARIAVRFLPPGSTYQGVVDMDFSAFTDLEMFISTKILMVFKVQPQEVGITLDVNRATGEIQQKIGQKRSKKPAVRYLTGILDDIIQKDFGAADLQFEFKFSDQEDDQVRMQTYETAIANGVLSIDEVRELEGKAALGVGPFYNSGGRIYFLPDLIDGTKNGTPAPVDPGGIFNNAVWPEIEKEFDQWERKAASDIQLGRVKKPFVAEWIPSSWAEEVEQGLAECQTVEAVKAFFAEVKKKCQTAGSGKNWFASSKKIFLSSSPLSKASMKNGGIPYLLTSPEKK